MRAIPRAGAAASAFAALAAAATALAGPALASPAGHHPGPAAGAVFVQTDDPGGNKVIAYHRGADGTLTRAGSYRTGGRGGQLGGSVVDHTASQGALAYDPGHRLLYVANAGSDSVSVFAVRGDLLALRQVVGSGGSFPVSVTVHGDAVYVLDARAGAVVQGYRVTRGRLVPVIGWHRTLRLPTGAPEFTHTPGQVAFSPDGRKLLVTTKAATSSVEVFAVDRTGRLSARAVSTSLPGAVPFAVAFDGTGHVAVAEAGTNAVDLFTISADRTLALVSSVLTGQAATCWLVRDHATLYASNSGSATLSRVRVRAGSVSLLGQTSTDPGTVDAAVTSGGGFLYAQAGATGTVDEFAVTSSGGLTAIGSVLVPDAAGAEGIVAT